MSRRDVAERDVEERDVEDGEQIIWRANNMESDVHHYGEQIILREMCSTMESK